MYKSIWAPAVGETLACEVKFGNIHDPSAVAVRKPGVGSGGSKGGKGGITTLEKIFHHFFIICLLQLIQYHLHFVH